MSLPQKETITSVCIDDFAIHKRHTYGTIMVDIESRRVIDLLPSRESEEVVEWLKTYPNLSIVSRDGSVSYHSAISQANAAIVQISDRFHLLKGFTDAAKKFLTRFLSANFRLPQKGSIMLEQKRQIIGIRTGRKISQLGNIIERWKEKALL